MNILIAGGSGEVGRYLARDLPRKGHSVVILDRAETETGPGATFIQGDIADADVVRSAVKGCDVVIHLAWSFSDTPGTIFGEDIQGHINLLDAAVSNQVKSFVYTSTATVYGRAMIHPVTETHPCLIQDARKPLYALGKYTAEELCGCYHKTRGLQTTIFRFWWAFGDTISGSHLRDLIRKALNGQSVEMVQGAGGAFLTMADLSQAVMLALSRPAAAGQIYNLGSIFVTWEDVAKIILDLTGSESPLKFVPSDQWHGPAFLNETWDLDWGKAHTELGYSPGSPSETMPSRLSQALRHCIADVQKRNL
jgi:nucleoside-diphosphate-sugar epimerase